MKWYNFETSFTSLARDLSTWLKAKKIKYELSDASADEKFEVKRK